MVKGVQLITNTSLKMIKNKDTLMKDGFFNFFYSKGGSYFSEKKQTNKQQQQNPNKTKANKTPSKQVNK